MERQNGTLRLAASLGLLALATLSCTSARTHSKATIPAALTASSRNLTFSADFMRISFVAPQTEVASLGRPGALRVFVTATVFFQPAMPVSEMATYPGLTDQPAQDLIAMRCVAPRQVVVDAFLATWPNVFAALQRDLAGKDLSCPSPADAAENEIYCIARQFDDRQSGVVVTTLAGMINAGNTLFDAGHPERAAWLSRYYGIFPAFSGLGFSVKDSYYLTPRNPTTAAQVLQNSVIPEYLLRNVSLADASCHCLRVPPYEGRSQAAIDPDFIWKKGGVGSCTSISRLGK